MNIFYRLICISILVMFLVGCSTTNTPIVSTSATPQISRPAPTISASENLSSTATPPTSILKSSVTPDIIQTVFAQELVSSQVAEQTLVAQYPHTCDYDLYFFRWFSPHKLWMVETCYSEVDESPKMTISKRDTQVKWELLYVDFLPNPNILPDGGLSIVHWSNDENYVYFNSFVSGSGGECFAGVSANQSGKGLFRLDLQTGDTTAILPLRDNFGGYGFSFSPTGRRLVYETYSSGISILDLQTGQLIEVYSSNADSVGGDYIWASNGSQFVYSVVATIDNWETRIYSLRLVNALSGNEQILFESPDICFAGKLWSDDDVLTLESYDENYERTLIRFDLSSNKIVSDATVTPFP